MTIFFRSLQIIAFMLMFVSMRSSWRRSLQRLCLLTAIAGAGIADAEPGQPDPAVDFSPLNTYRQRMVSYQGTPTIARAPKGRLWAAWTSGPKGEDRGNYVVAVTSGDNGKTWSDITMMVDPDGENGPLRGVGGLFWADPNGKLWFFWTTFPDANLSKSIVYAITTENPDSESPTWSEPRVIYDGLAPGNSDPIVTHQGEWLFPMQRPGQELSSMIVASSDEGMTWTLRGGAGILEKKDRNWDEHSIVELEDGSLFMLLRTSYGIGQSWSTDGGRTWTPVSQSLLPHTPARIYLTKLNSGNLLLVKHGPLTGKPVGRKLLTAYVSKDGGKTWEGGLLLDERKGVSYPEGTLSEDGTIYVVYDLGRYDERQILMATFTEEDVLAGEFRSDKGRLKQVIYDLPATQRPTASRPTTE